MRNSLLLLLACLMIPALVCRAATAKDAPDLMVNDQGAWYRADLRVTADNFGKTVDAAKGNLVDVALAENGSTGYTWRVSWAPAAALTLVRDTSENPSSNLPGAGGMRHFLLLVNTAQKIKVTVQYGRWWENGEKQEPQSFTLEAEGTSAKPTQAATVTITGADLDKPVSLRVGQTVEIVLDENRSTKWEWKCSWQPESGLKLTSDSYVQPRPIVAGQGGQRHLVLQARRSGKDIVTLQYQQWWDNGQKQAPKVMIVQVED